MLQRDTHEGTLGHTEGKTPMQRVGSSKEVASAIVWMCEDDSSFVIGGAHGVHGGFPTP
jgi:NAD(P)-dependent dehydrogenase (short-subunit alcohol dehydrogenase family)